MRTCLTCKVGYENVLQHMKTEWHTYNLRRVAVGLVPVSEEDFKAKQNELLLKSVKETPKEYFCCDKLFKSEGTYKTHLQSRKVHYSKPVKQIEPEIENQECEEETEDEEFEEGMIVEYMEESDSDNTEEVEEKILKPLTILDCLFCKSSFKTLEKNLQHMKRGHSFHLPYADYISNLRGLVEYLVSLVDEYNVCLHCNKQFDDRVAVSLHMRDNNHMGLYFDLESKGDDLSDFYANLPAPVPLIASHKDDTQIEAVLPSGKRVGNRKMNVYFKQNLNGLSNVQQLAITSGVEKAQMSLIRSGQYGSMAVSSQQTRAVVKAEKKSKTLESRNVQLRNSRFSNFQPHFRLQILM